MHSKDTWYKAVEPAIENPPDPPLEESLGECVVAFVSVEEGDGIGEARVLVEEIKAHAKRVGVKCALIYPFAHLSPELANPNEAYSVLVEAERLLRETWDGEVHRAPFGWYKAFRVQCAGHPMCELSRTIKGLTPSIYYISSDGSIKDLEEAISEALLPKGLLASPWSAESLELHRRFGLHPEVTSIGRTMIESLVEMILEKLVGEGANPVYRGASLRIDTQKALLESVIRVCLDSIRYKPEEPVIVALSDPANLVIAVSKEREKLDVKSLLGDLMQEFSDHLESLNLGKPGGIGVRYDVTYDGEILFYRTGNDSLIPLSIHVKVRGAEGSCIGPASMIVKALLDHGLRLASEGITPSLPFKIVPYQVAVIPVKETELDYAERVVEAIRPYARVYLDPPTRGLGARIRSAARLWTPYIIVIGRREVESNTITVRRRAGPVEQETMSVEALIEEISNLT